VFESQSWPQPPRQSRLKEAAKESLLRIEEPTLLSTQKHPYQRRCHFRFVDKTPLSVGGPKNGLLGDS